MLSVVAKSMLTLSGMAALFGAILAVASKAFAVHRDPKVLAVLDALPGVNCGACGFPGCQGYAEAAVEAGEIPTACPPGGSEVAGNVAEILGTEAGEIVAMVAVVHCSAAVSNSVQRLKYDGIEDCRAAMLVSGSPKACVFGCLSLGTCKTVCPFDAVELDDEGIVHIDRVRCTGCGKCVEACPVNIMELVSVDMRVHIRCSNHDKGKAAKAVCEVSCIACQLCVKKCPSDAIYMDENLAIIDYSKCTNCGVCAVVCPTKAIIDEVKARPKAVIGRGCDGNGKCKEVCPVKAIEGEPGERHEVTSTTCIGCGVCLSVCPTKSISMVGALGHQRGR